MRKRKMKEEPKEQSKKKRKKKKGFGYYLYAVVVMFLTIANITLATLLLTHVQQIDVTGTKYSKKEDVVEWFQEDPFTRNSIYSFVKIKLGKYAMPEYIESVDLRFKAPWAICLDIKEKQVMVGVLIDHSYVYIDKEGMVLLESKKMLEEIPVIEGLSVEKPQQFEKIQVKDKKIFTYMERISEEIEKNQLFPERIVWENDSMNLYFDEICVKLGKNNYGDKLIQVSSIFELGELEGKSGVLHLEHYSDMNENISFEENME